MNTIRRPRKRPRKSSVSFRTFGWLVIRQVALHVLWGPLADEDSDGYRRWLARASTDAVRRAVCGVLEREPNRRYYP